MDVVSPVGMWKILCDFFVVGWKLSPVLPQLEAAPVSNTAELLSPQSDVTYEFDVGCGGNVDLVETTLCCDDWCGAVCLCNNPGSSTWLVSGVQ